MFREKTLMLNIFASGSKIPSHATFRCLRETFQNIFSPNKNQSKFLIPSSNYPSSTYFTSDHSSQISPLNIPYPSRDNRFNSRDFELRELSIHTSHIWSDLYRYDYGYFRGITSPKHSFYLVSQLSPPKFCSPFLDHYNIRTTRGPIGPPCSGVQTDYSSMLLNEDSSLYLHKNHLKNSDTVLNSGENRSGVSPFPSYRLDSNSNPLEYHAISTLRRRKKKMNKHKHRKRSKRDRYKTGYKVRK